MKKIYRVKKEKDFKVIFQKKESKANKQFVIYYIEKEKQQHIRVGISVSKKLGNAVIRNHLKRKIRRAFHELDGFFETNYDIIVIARQSIVSISVEQIKSSLLHVLRLANIVKKMEE